MIDRMLIAITIFALSSPMATAQEANRVIGCIPTTDCSAFGTCWVATDTPVVFELEPVEVDQDGVGTYIIYHNYSGLSLAANLGLAANKVAPLGPIVWSEGDYSASLLSLSSTEMLWHQRYVGVFPTASVTFLTCEDSG